jgi:hypothetical protein
LLLALAALGPVSGDLVSNPLAPKEIGTTLLVLLGGALLAFTLARQPLAGPAGAGAATASASIRRLLSPIGSAFEGTDSYVRRWPSASIGLVTLAVLFGWLLVHGSAG